jgi:hypothetical protein
MMQRSRLTMFLGAMALALSGCLSPAAPDDPRTAIDEVQRATSLDETASTDPAQIPEEAAAPPSSDDPTPFEPCPCDKPICRPGCFGGPPPAQAAVEQAAPAPADGPMPFEPCPCDNPICRPVCKNP